MDVTNVSQESLQKALEALGLIEKAEVVTTTADVKIEELIKAEEELIAAQLKLEQLKNPKVEGVVASDVTLVKAEISEISKGFNDKIEAMATLIQSKDQKIEELTKAVTSINEFSKALASKLGMIAKTPLERKSVTTQGFVEKFEKKEEITKGADVKVLSISNNKHRAEIADELFNAATSGGKLDEELAKAAQCVELRQVTPAIQQRLLKDFKIQVVK